MPLLYFIKNWISKESFEMIIIFLKDDSYF